MGKIKQAQEKRERNAQYALKFKKKGGKKRRQSKWLNWCRTKGHPATCRVMDCPQK